MNSKALLDVLIVTYNHKNYISQALDGVLMQKTNFNFNIVVGDDCSTDGTIEILKEYEKKFPGRLNVIYQKKNLGPHHEDRNILTMIKNARSKYVALLDGDDYWTDESKLQVQVDFLENNPDFNICTHQVQIDKEGQISKNEIFAITKEVSTMNDLLVNNFIFSCTSVFRMPTEKLPHWFKDAMPGDYPLMIWVLQKKGKIKYIPKTMACYRIHAGGIWSLANKNQFTHAYFETLYNCILEFKLDNSIFPNKILLGIADNVYHNGFKYISLKKYNFYIINLLTVSDLTMRQKLFVFTAWFRYKFTHKIKQ